MRLEALRLGLLAGHPKVTVVGVGRGLRRWCGLLESEGRRVTRVAAGNPSPEALGAIKAKAIVMPGSTDLYFPPEDSQYEVSKMPNAEYRPIPSIWGHFAGGPGTNPEDVKFLDKSLKELLAS